MRRQRATCAGAAAIWPKVSSHLGEAVGLTIEARGIELGALDLAPLEAEFEIFARTLSRALAGETLVLTLYPRAARCAFRRCRWARCAPPPCR